MKKLHAFHTTPPAMPPSHTRVVFSFIVPPVFVWLGFGTSVLRLLNAEELSLQASGSALLQCPQLVRHRPLRKFLRTTDLERTASEKVAISPAANHFSKHKS